MTLAELKKAINKTDQARREAEQKAKDLEDNLCMAQVDARLKRRELVGLLSLWQSGPYVEAREASDDADALTDGELRERLDEVRDFWTRPTS